MTSFPTFPDLNPVILDFKSQLASNQAHLPNCPTHCPVGLFTLGHNKTNLNAAPFKTYLNHTHAIITENPIIARLFLPYWVPFKLAIW